MCVCACVCTLSAATPPLAFCRHPVPTLSVPIFQFHKCPACLWSELSGCPLAHCAPGAFTYGPLLPIWGLVFKLTSPLGFLNKSPERGSWISKLPAFDLLRVFFFPISKGFYWHFYLSELDSSVNNVWNILLLAEVRIRNLLMENSQVWSIYKNRLATAFHWCILSLLYDEHCASCLHCRECWLGRFVVSLLVFLMFQKNLTAVWLSLIFPRYTSDRCHGS